MGAKCDREAVGAGRKQAVLMETLPASDIVAIERHNLFVALGALGLFLLGSAFFSMSETGMMAVNRYKLKNLANQGHTGAKLAQKLLAQTDKLLGVILLGNNLINSASASLATVKLGLGW